MTYHLFHVALAVLGALVGAWFGLREGQRLAWRIHQRIA